MNRLKRLRSIVHSFHAKVTVTLILSLLFVTALSNAFIYTFSLDTQFQQLRAKLTAIAQTSVLLVDSELLGRVPLNREGIASDAYQAVSRQLRAIKAANPDLRYIYTMTKTDQEGFLQFIVDPEPVPGEEGRRGPSAYPGDKYYAARFPEMLKGFRQPTADMKIMVDEWGPTLSGYAPIRDRAGTTVALLGVDMSANQVYDAQKEVHRRFLLVVGIGIIVCVVLGFLISNRITGRIDRLVEGTRRIAADELDFKVNVKGHDEISELAGSFNHMASSLAESRRKLQDYFYRVVQSLVRILEAKDHYTRGHSERVADYARQIAAKMGFSPEKCEFVRRAGELHDIGKLVIHESILNKKGKLTDEEWNIIKEHPIIGEDALKPVLMGEEMLAMIRSHHERWDGKGYPDGIKGDSINIFAQIISVADAYDAMTSPRAYRQALNGQSAIEELRANAGSQFNTQVVRAFLKILEPDAA